MAPEWIWELALSTKASAAMEQIVGYRLPNAVQNTLYAKWSLTIRPRLFHKSGSDFPYPAREQ